MAHICPSASVSTFLYLYIHNQSIGSEIISAAVHHLQKVENRRDGHVQSDHQRHKEGDRSRGLRQHDHRVHEGVHQPGDGGRAEQVDGQKGGRIGQRVEEADGDQRQHVLEVVAVGTVYWK